MYTDIQAILKVITFIQRSLSELEEVVLFLPQQSATKTRDTAVSGAEYEAVLLENSVAVIMQIYDKYLCPNSSQK
jgi:hypothetical protein